MTVCVACKHWQLKDSPLRADGFGLCDANPSPLRAGHTFPPNSECRFGKFLPASQETVARRAKEGAS
ncbi:MAG: hypothetical protein EOO27_37880, partial [Comamonadaceae bacterium]